MLMTLNKVSAFKIINKSSFLQFSIKNVSYIIYLQMKRLPFDNNTTTPTRPVEQCDCLYTTYLYTILIDN